jgi:hypothetical protein
VKDKRAVTVDEFGSDDVLDVPLFKSITSGGGTYALRTFFDKTGGGDVVFKFGLWMSGNKPYGPPPDEDAAHKRIEVLDCTHVVPEEARKAEEEWALTHDQDVLDAAFALAVEGFKRLYGEKGGVLAGPESSQRAKETLREKLRKKVDEWSAVVSELFVFTGDADDGVLKTEAWLFAATEADIDRNSRKEQGRFEDSFESRGAAVTHSSGRWDGNRYWAGVQWSKYAKEHFRVTEPDWKGENDDNAAS